MDISPPARAGVLRLPRPLLRLALSVTGGCSSRTALQVRHVPGGSGAESHDALPYQGTPARRAACSAGRAAGSAHPGRS